MKYCLLLKLLPKTHSAALSRENNAGQGHRVALYNKSACSMLGPLERTDQIGEVAQKDHKVFHRAKHEKSQSVNQHFVPCAHTWVAPPRWMPQLCCPNATSDNEALCEVDPVQTEFTHCCRDHQPPPGHAVSLCSGAQSRQSPRPA